VENGTTILFGLPAVAVDRVEKDADGARRVHLRTADEAAAACPRCGVFSSSVRQRRSTRPRDLALRGGAAWGAVAQDAVPVPGAAVSAEGVHRVDRRVAAVCADHRPMPAGRRSCGRLGSVGVLGDR
jgi:hypothetical protein